MSKSTKIMLYVVLIEDRHAAVEARLFSQKDVAIQFARDVAKENGKRKEWIEEQELSQSMIEDGWVFCIKYSPEDDWVTVLERQLDDPAD